MNLSRPIVFFGTDEFSAASLRALLDGPFDVVLVVTKPDTKKGRGQKLVPSAVKRLASDYHIPVVQPEKLSNIESDIIDLCNQYPEGIAGVLVSYGKIVSQKIIDLFCPGIINVHPSILPRYRGPSPIESAILNGDAETGITIMQLSAKMDAGPIYYQKRIPLSGTETQISLRKLLAQSGAELLTIKLPLILSGRLVPSAQKDSLATYCQLLSKNDQRLDLSTVSAIDAERRIRAYENFPKTKYQLPNEDLIIIISGHIETISQVHNQKKSPLRLKCCDDVFLVVDELVTPNGKRISAQQYIRGYRI